MTAAVGARRERTADWSVLLDRAALVCGQNFTQMTKTREAVLRAVYASPRPIGAYDLAELLSAQQDGRIAPNSVYRILNLFQQFGLVSRVTSIHAFVIAPESAREGCLFLICDHCGAANAVDVPEIAATLTAQSRKVGFIATQHVLEILGCCESCIGHPATDDGPRV